MSKQLRTDTDGRLRGGATLQMPTYRYQRSDGRSETLSNRKSEDSKAPHHEPLCNLAL